MNLYIKCTLCVLIQAYMNTQILYVYTYIYKYKHTLFKHSYIHIYMYHDTHTHLDSSIHVCSHAHT